MQIRRFHIYLVDLNPRFGTEPGKIRPVIVVQSDLLNEAGHPSTLICPLTTNINYQSKILRVNLSKKSTGLEQDSDIMIDQVRAIDNKRFISEVGSIEEELKEILINNIKIVFDIV